MLSSGSNLLNATIYKPMATGTEYWKKKGNNDKMFHPNFLFQQEICQHRTYQAILWGLKSRPWLWVQIKKEKKIKKQTKRRNWPTKLRK